MKVAIAHDYLVNMGGSEKVVEQLLHLYPEAPIYTAICDPSKISERIASTRIITSFLQKLPGAKKRWQRYLPLMPLAFEQFDLSDYDLVISSNHSCSKGVITRPETCHICYSHTPMRYAWSSYHDYLKACRGFSKYILPPIMSYLRLWDRLSADRVDYFVCNSRAVKARIATYYGREAEVIPPPVDTSFFTTGEDDRDFYLIVARYMPYKRVDLAVIAFTHLGLPLVVVGGVVGYGTAEESLRKMAGPNISFVGQASGEELRDYYRKARAFIFPAEEDFGITAVEAQACGTPVIAYSRGGALDTVVEGRTGVFFEEQTPESLVEAVRKFEELSLDSAFIRRHAERFDESVFRSKMKAFVEEKYAEFQDKLSRERRA
ncbi:MAG: glycosyltransferase [Actinomycetota bacterium]|nr:glycosyltransferase [Actinomycetota bacterium]